MARLACQLFLNPHIGEWLQEDLNHRAHGDHRGDQSKKNYRNLTMMFSKHMNKGLSPRGRSPWVIIRNPSDIFAIDFSSEVSVLFVLQCLHDSLEECVK